MDISLAQGCPQRRHARYPAVDVLRGVAILGVVLFHLVWDLTFLGMMPPHWSVHPAWIAFGRTVAATFMLLVGVSLALAGRGGVEPRAFLLRLAKIAAAAIAITATTRLLLGDAFVYFGILHAIVAASVIGVAFLREPVAIQLLVGCAAIALGLAWQHAAFDPRAVAWIGFAVAPASSVDFVPVFPWAGFTLGGLAVARIGLDRGWLDLLPDGGGRVTRGLSLLGRRSLAIYLLHQPVLLAVLYPIALLVR